MRAKWVRMLEEAGVKVPASLPIEIDPVYASDAQELLKMGIMLEADV